MLKKACTLLLALALLCSLAPATAEETPVITIAREANALIEDLETNTFTRMLEEKFGVDLRFEEWSEAASKLSVLIGSNSELPDVINFSLDAATVLTYAEREAFIPLDAYFADPALSPYFQALSEDVKDVLLGTTRAADGHLYSIPQFGEYFPNYVNHNMLINQTWLDALGLAMPTTTDEFRAVLEAFVTDDPNGNGQADEFGLVSDTTSWGANVTAYLLNAFVPANPNKNYFYIQDGQARPAFMEDGFREGLAYVRGLVEDGLLEVTSFTQTLQQLQALLNSKEEAFVGVLQTAGHARFGVTIPEGEDAGNYLMYKHPTTSQYVLMDTLTGPQGQNNIIYNAPTASQVYFITPYCENPELAFMIGDYGYDPLMSYVSRHGEKGVHWVDTVDNPEDYRAAIIHGVAYEPKIFRISDPWTAQQNSHWMQTFPGYFSLDYNFTLAVPADMGPSSLEIIYEMQYDDVPEEYIATLANTSEEIAELAILQTTIDSYVKECILAFVTGNMSLERDWDRYITELENMNVDRYTELVQAGYDRTKP